jgi:hypothetical protein
MPGVKRVEMFMKNAEMKQRWLIQFKRGMIAGMSDNPDRHSTS